VLLAIDLKGLGCSSTICFGWVYVIAVPLAVGLVGLDHGSVFSY
jgi:hypothetical protein